MPDNPRNGKQRFEDLREQVSVIDGKVDKHSESLARIETLLEQRPCIYHDAAIQDHASRIAVIEGGTQVRIGRMATISAIVTGVMTALGAWLIHGTTK